MTPGRVGPLDVRDPRVTATRVVRRPRVPVATSVEADVCVVGAGISGISAAIESARLGRKVAIVDAMPRLGGQAVNGIIGTFAGLMSNGPHPYRFTYGIADDILRVLGSSGNLFLRRAHNTVMYDDGALSRWIEDEIYGLGITVVSGAVVRRVEVSGRRVQAIELATRYGDALVSASGFVDASGDAVVAWNAGLPCQEPAEGTVYGSQKVVLEGVVEEDYPTPTQLREALERCGEKYGVTRKDGLANLFRGKGRVILNAAHIETPLDPILAAQSAHRGRLEAQKTIDFLRGEFPVNFGAATIKSFGLLGVRQTRWIVGTTHLTVDDILAQRRFDDSIARTGWGVELHNEVAEAIWEPLPEDHVHYIPLGSLTPPDVDNLVAAGRCIDADVAALSSVRVMGPCIAMGAAAAHALEMAGEGSVHELDVSALQERLHDNLHRRDPYLEATATAP